MMPTKSCLLNFGVFIILVIRPRARAVTVKYEEPFPPQLPVQVKSRVAFTQYGNVPMLGLDEIKKGFPWLEMSAENVADHDRMGNVHRPNESGPRYMFYYLPTDVALQSGGVAAPGTRPDVPNSFGDKSNRHKFQVENNRPAITTKELTRKVKSVSKKTNLNKKMLNIDTVSKDKKLPFSGRPKVGVPPSTLPQNHKFTDQDFQVEAQYFNVAETRSVPRYSYPKIPSPYMQPPRLKFEEKEFWVKNKRKSKRPTEETDFGNEGRLKNHRNVKQKKSKKVNPKDEKRLRDRKPTYDREHDPEEGAESSDAKVEELPRHPKEKTTQNPLLLSQDGERVEFQIHGHEGPQTYIFGYDTGNGNNRHFRLEERLRDGSVKGHYGYYDVNGKLKMVEYKTRPMEGYEEKHHTSDAHTSADKEDGGSEAKS